jgi:superfamily II DNA or RNA helicase
MKVTVTVMPGALIVDPWIPTLNAHLKYTKKVKQDKWPYKMLCEEKYLYTTSKADDGRVVGLTYEGMWHTVLTHLQNIKTDLQWVDTRPPIPDADLSMLEELRPLQERALDVVLNHPIGIIECPPGFGKTFLICQVARIYPESVIVVTTPRQAVADSIYKRLKASVPDPKNVRKVKGGSKFPKTGRVFVVTAGSIHKIPEQLPDIYMYDECHGSATPRQIRTLERFTFRRYGLSASPDGRLDGADLEINAMFGPVQCLVTYQEAVDNGLVVPIEVEMRHVQHPEPLARTDTAKQRFGYWRNVIRNLEIATVARQHGPEESVLILVRTLEHALFLRLLLPEFFIVHGGVPETEEGNDKWNSFCELGLVQDTPEFREHIRFMDDKLELAQEMFADGRIRKVIATPKWREGVDFPSLSVLIRADGSSGSIDAIQIVGRLSRLAPGKAFGKLYDFFDDFGESYKGKSYSRMRHYAKQGWSIDRSRLP